MNDRPEHRLLWRPLALQRVETAIARRLPVHPDAISFAKLAVTPAVLWALACTEPSITPWIVFPLLAVYGALDYLDGVVARGQNRCTRLGRMLDRATDYPLIVGLALLCVHVLPPLVLAVRLGLDVLLFALFAAGLGSTENRVRTVLSWSILLALLCLSRGWLPGIVTASRITVVLWVSVGFSALVALYNLRVVKKSNLADALSLANLVSGVIGMMCAVRGRLDLALLMLLFGAICDGLDGAAARRFGGSRLGVLADDVADGVSYGIAPAVALWITLGGWAGPLLAALFAVCTLGRLVFFTLTKGTTDPGSFRGAPSTVGAILVLCALNLFAAEPLLVGGAVGAACVLMVSFDVRHRHLGRALTPRRATLLAPPAAALLLFAVLADPRPVIALLFAGALVYSAWPTLRASFEAVRDAWASRGARRAAEDEDPEADPQGIA